MRPGFKQFPRNLCKPVHVLRNTAWPDCREGQECAKPCRPSPPALQSASCIRHKFQTVCCGLDPNNAQATYLARAAGVARFAYNWALAEWKRQYEIHKADPAQPMPSQLALRRQLNAIKREQFPWMLEVTKNAPQMAIIQLGEAFQNFFACRARYPRPRRKGVHDRFSLTNEQFRVENRRIHIPKLGWVRMREALRFTGRIVNATVSRRAGKWDVSITVDTLQSPLPPAENQDAVGVDLGVYARIGNPRREGLHQITTSIARRFHTIGIEDLNVKGMLANRHLSRAIADMSFRELRRQLEYKAAWRGGEVVVVDRWYPSSKTCSRCGHRLENLALDLRQWTCPGCGANHDRDLNAAINLKNMAVSSIVSACGGEGAGPVREHETKPAPVKQESNSKAALGNGG